MFRNEKLEMKVGLFIGAGIFLMFLLVFAISDFYLFEDGYSIVTKFDFVSGITPGSPVRYAGVQVGEVRDVSLFYDDDLRRSRVKVTGWVRSGTDISKDSVFRVNSLGLLGEQYLEITPGYSEQNLKPGDKIQGSNPVNMSEQMEKVNDLMGSLTQILDQVESGEGSLGRFLFEDDIYMDVRGLLEALQKGEGTLGKLLYDDGIYQEIEGFVRDLRRQPWRLLHRPSRQEREEERSRGTEISPKN